MFPQIHYCSLNISQQLDWGGVAYTQYQQDEIDSFQLLILSNISTGKTRCFNYIDRESHLNTLLIISNEYKDQFDAISRILYAYDTHSVKVIYKKKYKNKMNRGHTFSIRHIHHGHFQKGGLVSRNFANERASSPSQVH